MAQGLGSHLGASQDSAGTTAQPWGQALGARSLSCWGSGACGWTWRDSLSLGCSPGMGAAGLKCRGVGGRSF